MLVVEDADAVRLLVRDMLVSCGYTVLEARDGVDALDVARAHDGAIDLLVTDVVMPGLSGPQLAAQLEAERPALRTLMMSGYAGESLLRYRGSVASWTLLQKPFAPLTLVQAWIAKDGTIRELKLIRGSLLLGEAAYQAVKQWHYKPYLRNGQAVEAQTYVTVDFRLP